MAQGIGVAEWKTADSRAGSSEVQQAIKPLTPEGHEPERFESKLRKNKTGGNQHKKRTCDRPSVLPVVWRVAERERETVAH